MLPEILIFFNIVVYGYIHEWAREVVKEGRTVSRIKVFLAVFTLLSACYASVAALGYAKIHILQASLKAMTLFLYLLVGVSCYNFFPLYTLLRRKLIPKKIFMVSGLALLATFLLLLSLV